MAEMRPCRSCRRQCVMARTVASGQWMPLEEDAEHGNVLVDDMGRAHVFRDNAAAVEELEREPWRWSVLTFVSHHARCPKGGAWRRRERKPAPNPRQGTLL